MAALRCIFAGPAIAAVSCVTLSSSSNRQRSSFAASPSSSWLSRTHSPSLSGLSSGQKFGGYISLCEASKPSNVAMATVNSALEAQAPSKDDVLPQLMTEFMVDMHCEGCVKAVRTRLEPLEGVSTVDVDLENQVVRVLATTPLTSLTSALEKSGRKSRLIGQGSPEKLALSAAVAEFKGPVVHGVVRFAQVSQESTRVEATFDGLSPGAHAWFINDYGDLTRGADSTGGHYSPAGAVLGRPDDEVRDAGHLGALEADEKGHAEHQGASNKLQVWDLIGRAVVVHEGDVSSPGKGIAAAVIARSAGVGENYKKLCLCDGTVIWEATNSDYVK
eukprot:jgi/Mesen1/11059/ME000099S10497